LPTYMLMPAASLIRAAGAARTAFPRGPWEREEPGSTVGPSETVDCTKANYKSAIPGRGSLLGAEGFLQLPKPLFRFWEPFRFWEG